MRGLPEIIAANEKAAKNWLRKQSNPKRTTVQQERVRGRLLKTYAAAMVIGLFL